MHTGPERKFVSRADRELSHCMTHRHWGELWMKDGIQGGKYHVTDKALASAGDAKRKVPEENRNLKTFFYEL